MASKEVRIIDYADLQADQTKDLQSIFETAFGPEGSGIIAVRNVPGFVDAKTRLLPMAHTLQGLPADYLEEKLVDPKSLYNSGWSLGKEKMGDGAPDTAKGSFYYNPCTDTPGTELDRQTYPLSYPTNLWPSKEVMPEFEEAAKTLGCLMKKVTVDLSRHLDAYLQIKVPSYQPNTLYHAIEETEKVKCRLLYYFPQQENKKPTSWIGWHNDSGFLTALAGDLYLDHTTGKVLDTCPDDQAGLYVADRQDEIHRVVIPPDCMAIQMGECTQILSGGVVCATPHWVRAAKAPNVSRVSLAAFVDTPPQFPLYTPKGQSKEYVCHSDQQSKRVPPLEKRWTENGMAFGDFLTQTFEMYYNWTSS